MGGSHPALEGLEPAALWQWFSRLAEIPRPSKHEDKVISFLKQFAKERELGCQQDDAGNVVIKRAGSSGGEDAPPVIIQGHLDMVCSANKGVEHDFRTDAIRLLRDGDWVTADGTTLGADNGIGVAAALALLDEPASAKLPPLECLFTTDEEEGMTGAAALDGSMLKGKILLNLDTEEAGQIYIGCAGGGDSRMTLAAQLEASPRGSKLIEVVVGGLIGGHSGLNIHEGRGNALVLLAHALERLLKAVPGSRLVTLAGGDKSNAITREASAQLLVPAGKENAVEAELADEFVSLCAQYELKEPDMLLAATASGAPHPEHCLADDAARRLLGLLLLVPHGPWKMSHAIPGLVETSNNLASCHPRDVEGPAREFEVVTCTRSSIMPALEGLRDRIECAARMAGAEIQRGHTHPGWAPNPNSRIVQIAKEVFQEVTGEPPGVLAIHAGLECGILGERIPGVDCVSFGPTITGAHSPDERVQVSTVPPFYDAARRILEAVADGRYGKK